MFDIKCLVEYIMLSYSHSFGQMLFFSAVERKDKYIKLNDTDIIDVDNKQWTFKCKKGLVLSKIAA